MENDFHSSSFGRDLPQNIWSGGGFELLKNHSTKLRNAARAQGQDHVARLRLFGDRSDGVRKRGSVGDASLPCSAEAAYERLRRDAFNGLLACRINIQHAKGIGIGKSIGEISHQIASTGEAMGLKDDVHSPVSALASRSESGANFRGMMSIIVDHVDARSHTFELEAAIDTTKCSETGANLLRGNVERGAHSNGRCSVKNIVCAGHMQRKLSEIPFLVGNLKSNAGLRLFGGWRRSNRFQYMDQKIRPPANSV